MSSYLPLLYIDPGTGSALFSIIIGITAVAFFAFQAIYIKAKVFFSGGRAKTQTRNKYVVYAEDKRYWTLFKSIIEEFENRGIELSYLTSSKDDPIFNAGFKFIKPEYIGEGNKAFARLNFLSADFVLATTPGLDVYQWKRSKNVKHYCHIRHSADEPVKYEMFGMDYFDSILVSGKDFQHKDIRKLEELRNLPEKQVVTTGCPYLDEYAKRIENIPDEENHVFTVLVSPSWGPSALLSKFGKDLLDPLEKTGWRIIVRPHPQSLITEKEVIKKLSDYYSGSSNFIWDFEPDNIYSLKKADIMISDFSGIILDYMFLRNKPVIYVKERLDWRAKDAYDLYKDQSEMWTFKNLERTGIELKPELFNELQNIISGASSDSALENAIKEVKDQAWCCRGESGKVTADFMIKTVEAMSA